MPKQLFLTLFILASGGGFVRAQVPPTATEPVTILFSITAKEGKEHELADVIAQLLRISRADDGNISYTFLQQRSNPREYVLFEQWRDSAALKQHIGHLQTVFGAPRQGSSLPAAILDLCEKTQAITYRVVE